MKFKVCYGDADGCSCVMSVWLRGRILVGAQKISCFWNCSTFVTSLSRGCAFHKMNDEMKKCIERKQNCTSMWREFHEMMFPCHLEWLENNCVNRNRYLLSSSVVLTIKQRECCTNNKCQFGSLRCSCSKSSKSNSGKQISGKCKKNNSITTQMPCGQKTMHIACKSPQVSHKFLVQTSFFNSQFSALLGWCNGLIWGHAFVCELSLMKPRLMLDASLSCSRLTVKLLGTIVQPPHVRFAICDAFAQQWFWLSHAFPVSMLLGCSTQPNQKWQWRMWRDCCCGWIAVSKQWSCNTCEKRWHAVGMATLGEMQLLAMNEQFTNGTAQTEKSDDWLHIPASMFLTHKGECNVWV